MRFSQVCVENKMNLHIINKMTNTTSYITNNDYVKPGTQI